MISKGGLAFMPDLYLQLANSCSLRHILVPNIPTAAGFPRKHSECIKTFNCRRAMRSAFHVDTVRFENALLEVMSLV